MATYQELLSERDRLKRRVVELEQRIRQLEGTTALVLARKLHAYRHHVLFLLKFAMAANRLRRRIMGGGDSALPVPDMALDIDFPARGLDPARETVIVISHEASQTGGPILAWNVAAELSKTFNVVCVLIDGGVLLKTFQAACSAVIGPIGLEIYRESYARKVAWQLARKYKPLFVIANTSESRYLAAPLARDGVPVVSLIHEFAAGLLPVGTMQYVFDWSSFVVFPAAVVRNSFLPTYKSLRYKRTPILPQGKSILPTGDELVRNDPNEPTREELLKKLRPEGREDALLVVGMGPADFRKGADLFMATAHIARRLAPDAKFRWAWVGSAHDPLFLNFIGEQLYRSGLQDDLVLIDTLSDIDTVYEQADLLFVSSRFDPMPNVAIDIMLKGKPVLCFDQATGVADVLKSMPESADLAVPYLDVARAAEVLIALANDRERLRSLGRVVRTKAEETFDMKRYVGKLVELGREASAERAPRADKKALLMQEGNFDVPLYLGKLPAEGQREESVDHYLNYATKISVARRALAGFHPGTYAELIPDVNRNGWSDPLVHFLRAGKPAGPWLHQVIRLDEKQAARRPASTAALHGHFYYTDNIADFRSAMAVNRGRYDVFLTTGSEAKRDELAQAMEGHDGLVDIEIVPNLGRDIGPFLHTVRTRIAGKYDIVGHIHGKRSVHAHTLGPNVGELWRNFLWQQLLGPQVPAADAIVRAFEAQPKLGVVFPEDPNVIGWDDNLDFARDLARRMNFRHDLPQNIDFPVGTMFWARVAAVQPMVDLGLSWNDYPPEPIALDGTILHAMERLIPSVAREAGFDFATTYLPGVGR